MSSRAHSLRQTLLQIGGYIGFVARRFPAFHGLLALTLAVLALEYIATSLMIPLAPGKASDASAVTRAWLAVASQLGLPPVSRTWLWLFFVLMTLRIALGYVLSVLTTWLGKRVHETLSEQVFSHVVSRETMGLVYTRSVGHYITLAGDDTFKSGTIITAVLQAGVGLATALVGLGVLYQFSPDVFIGVTLFIALALVIAALLLRQVIRINAQAVGLSRELGTHFVESLNSLRSIRSLGSESFVIRTYVDQIRRYVRMLVKLDAIKTAIKTFPAVALLLVAALVMRPGAEVSMSDATLVGGTLIVIRVFAALGQMATAGAQLLADIRAVKDIQTLIAWAEEPNSHEQADSTGAVQSIALRDVTFAYGDRGPVLSRLSFEFRSGHTYAIVGPSGAGKSTLADVLLGHARPDQGTIAINSRPVSSMGARAKVVLVEQQPKIFSSTLRENLLLGAHATDDQLMQALAAVDLDRLVASLNHGLDTRLSYLGENFSGGQRQRLGIARALVRQPDVLILDEATSALDTATRSMVVTRLRHRLQNGIIIFITHDPEIAGLADEVLALGGTASPAPVTG